MVDAYAWGADNRATGPKTAHKKHYAQKDCNAPGSNITSPIALITPKGSFRLSHRRWQHFSSIDFAIQFPLPLHASRRAAEASRRCF
jgi:hypothetical protein